MVNKKYRRVVIKVGTSTLTYDSGLLNYRRVEQLVRIIADLKNDSRQIVLVSSGAIGVGFGKLGVFDRPGDVPSKQAAAAIGQCELMYRYDKLFSEFNHHVAQVLLTKDVVADPLRKQNVVNTFERLFDYGVLPVVNENDTVAVDEIESSGTFGDNDSLSAIVAELVGAQLLIILSDIDGLFDCDPHKNPNAKLIREVSAIDETIAAMAGGVTSRRGTGGMMTKIAAARIATTAGIDVIVMNGKNPKKLYDIFEGENPGTFFAGRSVD